VWDRSLTPSCLVPQGTPHTEACLQEGRRLGRIVCVACGAATQVVLGRPRHHETPEHRRRVAWLKRPPTEQAPFSLPLQQHSWQSLAPQQQQQQQVVPPSPTQQPALPPQLPLPQLVGSMPELAAAPPEPPPPLTVAEAVAAVAAGAAAAAAAAAEAVSDSTAAMLGRYTVPSAPAAGQQLLQRGSAPSLGPLGTPAAPLTPLIPPSRSLDSAGLPRGLPGLRSLSDERLGAAQGMTGSGNASWPALAAVTSMQAAPADLLPCFLKAWEPQRPQRLPLPTQQHGGLSDLQQMLPACQAPVQLGSGGSGDVGGSPAAYERAASQHRFLSQLQQQGLQHQLDGAAQGMQLS
jgi:hypothetical protein